MVLLPPPPPPPTPPRPLRSSLTILIAVYELSAYADVVVGDYTKIWRRLKVARRAAHAPVAGITRDVFFVG
jgi:hypothetical protein